MTLEIAKAGWLYRQSTILRRWKKTWFVLYQDGDLRYFESPNSHEPEARIVVRAVCSAIQAGQMCEISAPEGKTKDCLITLILRDGELRLCAEDPDDMRAWQIALEEARVLPPGSAVHALPPPYTAGHPMYTTNLATDLRSYPYQVPGANSVMYPRQQVQYYYPGQVLSTNPYTTVMAPPAGQHGNNIVYVNQLQQDQYLYGRRRYDGGDLAMGMVAGAALGSMMWGPVLYW
ncbi:pleckstrin homology domain-containing family B member 2-like [Mizuhopecten yessoensis]|uniref:Pleckstrin homology domain-containing family B member 2 n=1 Tax=Mizuhopecten yessoensis TaxID=6573 RepID=A0A210PVE7_MIZYE|nr:pleckstrin homology domain-containing family B member 2-like [Mizuhopecten yessoensis]OWF40444.1 Pleckstrin homology domain-containing family B member 2 [Mizuhopecten yessoensis]